MNIQNFDAENEVLLLRPVSIIVEIKRNLSAAWYNDIPDIEISGRLKRIDVLLNQEDYTVIMKTLTENLGESAADGANPQAIAAAERKKMSEGPNKAIICKNQYITYLEVNSCYKIYDKIFISFLTVGF